MNQSVLTYYNSLTSLDIIFSSSIHVALYDRVLFLLKLCYSLLCGHTKHCLSMHTSIDILDCFYLLDIVMKLQIISHFKLFHFGDQHRNQIHILIFLIFNFFKMLFTVTNVFIYDSRTITPRYIHIKYIYMERNNVRENVYTRLCSLNIFHKTTGNHYIKERRMGSGFL